MKPRPKFVSIINPSTTRGISRMAAGGLDFIGATRRTRTDDLLITNQLLYQLS
jgi:hypothetical protein